MNELSLSETTKKYLAHLNRLDRDLSELCKDENFGRRENSNLESLSTETISPNENQQLRKRVENIQNAFRTIRAEVSTLADLSGLQPLEEVSTGTSLSDSSSQAVLDVIERVITTIERACPCCDD